MRGGTGEVLTNLRTGEVAEQAGVNVQTLRYYERRGLITSPQRTPGGHRAYPPDTVTLIGVIKAAQRLGFTLEEVADLLDTGRRTHPATDLQDRVRAKLGEIDQKLRDLTPDPRHPPSGDRRRLRQPDRLLLQRLPPTVRRACRRSRPVTVQDHNPDRADLTEHAQPIDSGPPRRSAIAAALAALACAACCALPVLIAGGLLTASGAALTQNILLATAGLLFAAAAGLWWLKRRTAAASAHSGCAAGNCSC